MRDVWHRCYLQGEGWRDDLTALLFSPECIQANFSFFMQELI